MDDGRHDRLLTYGTTYFAQATQGAQTSLVFTFTPTQPAPTAVGLVNGGTAEKADSNDSATVTFNEQLNATTICAAWSNSGIQTVTNATITFTSGTPDYFTATSATCTGGGNFGTVYTGSTNYVDGHRDLHELDDRVESEQRHVDIHTRNPGQRWSQRGHQRRGKEPRGTR